jgi:hypothetical protein
VLERGRQEVEFGKDVGLSSVGHSGGLAVAVDRQRAGAAWRTGVADAPYLGQLQIAVPVGQDVGDGRLAGAASDQQPRVTLQQQPLVAGGKAPTGER